MPVPPVPAGYHSVTPYLIVKGAARAIEFYQQAFGAVEVFRMPMGDKIGHAEIRIGDSFVMLADEHPEMDALSPQSLGGSAVSLMVYVEDVDSVFRRALDAGATQTRPVRDQFYGDRSGNLKDPFGHTWTVATHVEDVTPEQLQERMRAMSG